MKKREKTIREASKAFQKRYPKCIDLCKEIDELYWKWGRLFRMVNSPHVFFVLRKNLKSDKELQEALRKDFETQYKNPCTERENSTAKTSTQTIQLLDARTYFDGKCDTIQTKRELKKIKKLLKESCLEASFTKAWEKHYGLPLQPIYYKSPIVEAREALNALINGEVVLNHNFDDVPTYSQYSVLVNNNSVEMSGTLFRSGLIITFKRYLEEGGTFEKLCNDPKKKRSSSTK